MKKIEIMNEARQLVVVLGYSQKEASIKLGVSQKTMCNWSKKYKWKSEIENLTQTRLTLNEFLIYIKNIAPNNYNKIKGLSNNYIDHLNYKIDKKMVE